MKIGVLSDTHIPGRGRVLPARIFDAFADVAMILHAGDVASLQVLDDLRTLAPVYAVRGNVDPPELWPQLPMRREVSAGEVRIGLIHGHGTLGRTEERAREAFRDADVACIVFGHSHDPLCEMREGVLLFNPGSPTDRRRQAQHSYGMLTVTGTHVEGEIIRF